MYSTKEKETEEKEKSMNTLCGGNIKYWNIFHELSVRLCSGELVGIGSQDFGFSTLRQCRQSDFMFTVSGIFCWDGYESDHSRSKCRHVAEVSQLVRGVTGTTRKDLNWCWSPKHLQYTATRYSPPSKCREVSQRTVNYNNENQRSFLQAPIFGRMSNYMYPKPRPNVLTSFAAWTISISLEYRMRSENWWTTILRWSFLYTMPGS